MPFFRRNRREDAKTGLEGMPSPIDESGRLRVACWYCEEAIEYDGFDPCAVILVTNWAEESKQREQQFFAHADCFRTSGSGTDLYVLEDDFDQT